MFAWTKTLSLCLISVIVEFELHTRKITLDLLKKTLVELAVSPKGIRILLKAYLFRNKKLNLENLTPKMLNFFY
jgi:hypothetical protein